MTQSNLIIDSKTISNCIVSIQSRVPVNILSRVAVGMWPFSL